MNDRYLFRAKRTDNGGWVEGYLIYAKKDCYICEKPYECMDEYSSLNGQSYGFGGFKFVDPSTICQCTGLKDKNGKLIWENDIVDASFGWWYASDPAGHDSPIIKVEWDDGYCGFTPFADYDCDCGVYIESNDVKVIGNIFDNPELLEVGE